MNMSATILREIVASTLKVKATEVILSGILPKDYLIDAVSTSGNLYTDENSVQMYAFNPEEGLILIPNEIISENAASNTDGSWENSYGYTYHSLSIVNAIFFVEVIDNYYKDDNREEKNFSVTLFKSPDFKEYLNKIEKKDIARWEQWIKE